MVAETQAVTSAIVRRVGTSLCVVMHISHPVESPTMQVASGQATLTATDRCCSTQAAVASGLFSLERR